MRLANLVDFEIRRVLTKKNEVGLTRVREIQLLVERMGIRLERDLVENDRVLEVTQRG